MHPYLVCTHAMLSVFDEQTHIVTSTKLYDNIFEYARNVQAHISIPIIHIVFEDLLADGSLYIEPKRLIRITKIGERTKILTERFIYG